MRALLASLWLAGAVAGCAQAGSGADAGADGHGWTPPQVHVDTPFIQEVAHIDTTLADARAIELGPGGRAHVVNPEGVWRRDRDTWTRLPVPPERAASDLAFGPDGTLATVGPGGARIGDQDVDLAQPAAFVAPRAAGGWWLAGEAVAGYWDGGYHSIRDQVGTPVRALVDLDSGRWLAATPEGVCGVAGCVTTADGLPSNDARALAAGRDGTVWAGTAAGLARRDPQTGSWTAFPGEDGLHYGDVVDLAFGPVAGNEGSGDVLLVATGMGASRYHPDGTRRYYFGRIWLPDNRVRGMARAADGTVWLATAGGVSRIEQRSMTLADKAALFDAITHERHVRLGYTSTENRLENAGDLTSFSNHDDDNDGQWTSMYLASQCFRYAVTGSDQAREHARTAARALMKLEEVAGDDGFFARSIVPADRCAAKQEGPGEWHLSADGQWCWKGDTSSDEFVGHMFGLSLFHDLVADEAERAEAARTIGRMVGTIVDNGFRMLDIDGAPTSHGHFDPDFMENDLTAILGDAGLNSAMILGALHAAHHMTGEQRFRDAFEQLAHDHGYKEYVSRIEEINLQFHTNHDSEEMSFLAMYTLMRYEDDSELLALWRKGLQYLWEVQRPERNPEFNVMYAALARAEEYDLDASIGTLQKLPLDLVLWGLDHAHRWDRQEDPRPDRFGRPQNSFVFPYDERQAMRWAENPYAYEQRGDGHAESSGTFWLLPYWMGRYHGLIE